MTRSARPPATRERIFAGAKCGVAALALFTVLGGPGAGAAPLTVAIDKLDATFKNCGLSEAQLEGVARRTLERSPVKPDAALGGSLRVGVTGTRSRRGPCAGRLSIQMKAFRASGGSAHSRSRSASPVTLLCSKRSDYAATKAAFPLEIESALESSIRECLGSLAAPSRTSAARGEG